MTVWRWHITMISSIFHRVSGVALYVTAAFAVCWLLALSTSPHAFAGVQGFILSPIGKLALIGAGAAAGYHLANGVRHMAWDLGHGFDPKTANLTAWLSIACGVIGAALVAWALCTADVMGETGIIILRAVAV